MFVDPATIDATLRKDVERLDGAEPVSLWGANSETAQQSRENLRYGKSYEMQPGDVYEAME
ncbi:hypothetical protein E4U41_004883 [Claviceps citrina]|nr:hypothetical protein E4U41_004883 [Claviceps citrina]